MTDIDESDSDFNLIKNHVTGKSRISQACDRCRIKKIKCDGKLPNCTNCELINFNCKISDKLTRNSFPKGYTKNLEKQLMDLQLEKSNLLAELDYYKKQNNTNTLNSTTINSPSTGNTIDILKVNPQGIIMLDQFIKHPLNLFFNSLDLYTFNGYESIDESINTTNQIVQKDDYNQLSNYHMNLNRYLNLIFYKLICPLISIDDSTTSNKTINLDNLIHLFFNNYNKVLNILNFDIIYNDYLKFKNKYNQLNSNYYDSITGELKKKFHNFNTKEQDFLIKLILIMKFQLTNLNSNYSFNEALKIINLENLKLCFNNINFNIDPTLEKLENCLLFIYYYMNFENNNLLLTKFNKQKQNHDFLLNIIQTSNHLLINLNIHKNLDHLSFIIDDEKETPFELSQILKIQRIKLFWIYKLLIKWFKISYNFNTSIFDIDNLSDSPKALDSIRLLDLDLFNTIKLFELLQLIPNNLFELIINDYENNNYEIDSILSTVDRRLVKWYEKLEKSSILTENNANNSFQLLSIYYFLRILINLKYSNDNDSNNNPSENLLNEKLKLFQLSNDYIDLSYNILTNSNFQLNDFFQFGKLLQLISIICIGKLGSNQLLQSKLSNNTETLLIEINNKVLKILKIYQSSIINLKITDPSITSIVKYIKEKLDLNSPSPQQQPDSSDLFYNNDDELNDLFLYKSTDLLSNHNQSKPLLNQVINNNNINNNNSVHHMTLNLFDSNIFDNQSPIYDPLTAFKEETAASSITANNSLKRVSNSSHSSNKRQLKSSSSSPTSSIVSLSANSNSLFPSSTSSSVSRTPSIHQGSVSNNNNRRYSVSSSINSSYPSLFNTNNSSSSTNSTPLIKPYSSKSSKKQRSFSLSTINHHSISNNHSNDTLFDSLSSANSSSLRKLKTNNKPINNDTLFNITETSPAQPPPQQLPIETSSSSSNDVNSIGMENSKFDRMSIQSDLTSISSSQNNNLNFSKIDHLQQNMDVANPNNEILNQDEIIHSTNDILNDFLTNTIPSTPHILHHSNSYSNILNQLDSSSVTLIDQKKSTTPSNTFDLKNMTTLHDDDDDDDAEDESEEPNHTDSDSSVLNVKKESESKQESRDDFEIKVKVEAAKEDVNKNLFASAIGGSTNNFSYSSSPNGNNEKLKSGRDLMEIDCNKANDPNTNTNTNTNTPMINT